VPAKRSAKAFMFGAWIAIRTTRVSTAARARTKLAPNFESGSHERRCTLGLCSLSKRRCLFCDGSNGRRRHQKAERRGFGFIDAGSGKDLFFHRSGVEGVRFEDLQQGQRVSFTEGQGPKGPRAEKVFSEMVKLGFNPLAM
jgi:CspA family cold shock protein